MTIKTIMMEKFAALEHERWAKWQKYFFSKCQIKPQSQVNGMDDRYVYLALPKDLYERWLKQIETPYSELSEQEKESDREQVRPYLEEFSTLLDEIERENQELIGRHNARILNQFQTEMKPDMPLIAYDERVALIPAITKIAEETKKDILSTLNKYRV